MAYDFMIMNTCFKTKKWEEHIITYKRGTSRSYVVFLFVRIPNKTACKDCKVIPKESLTSEHNVLVLAVCFKNSTKLKT